MYEIECLTNTENTLILEEGCSPFSGMCYPEAEGNCGPECNPNPDDCSPW